MASVHSQPIAIISFKSLTANAKRIVRQVHKLGFAPLVILDQAVASEWQTLPERNLALVSLVVDSIDRADLASSRIVSTLQVRRADFGPIARWVNLDDSLTDTVLRCIEELGLDDLEMDAYRDCRVKPIAKRILYQSRIQGHTAIVAEVENTLIPPVDFPCIVKPITGTASRLVSRLNCLQDWIDYQDDWRARRSDLGIKDYTIANLNPASQVLFEPYLAGDEVRADGYVDAGVVNVCIYGYRVTEWTGVGFREVGGVSWKPEQFDGAADFSNWLKRVLRFLGFRTGVFHLEAVRAEADTFELVEINPRPGGGGVVPIVRMLSGVDLMEEFIRLSVGHSARGACGSQSKVSSALYCVLYGGETNKELVVADLRYTEETKVTVPGFEGLEATWIPFVELGERLNPFQEEHYLGELHIRATNGYEWGDYEGVARSIREAQEWLKEQQFIQFKDVESIT